MGKTVSFLAVFLCDLVDNNAQYHVGICVFVLDCHVVTYRPWHLLHYWHDYSESAECIVYGKQCQHSRLQLISGLTTVTAQPVPNNHIWHLQHKQSLISPQEHQGSCISGTALVQEKTGQHDIQANLVRMMVNLAYKGCRFIVDFLATTSWPPTRVNFPYINCFWIEWEHSDVTTQEITLEHLTKARQVNLQYIAHFIHSGQSGTWAETSAVLLEQAWEPAHLSISLTALMLF